MGGSLETEPAGTATGVNAGCILGEADQWAKELEPTLVAKDGGLMIGKWPLVMKSDTSKWGNERLL